MNKFRVSLIVKNGGGRKMQLKDMNYVLSTSQPIRIFYPTGDSNIARLDTFERYKDWIVTSIWCKNEELCIEIRNQECEFEESIQPIMAGILEEM